MLHGDVVCVFLSASSLHDKDLSAVPIDHHVVLSSHIFVTHFTFWGDVLKQHAVYNTALPRLGASCRQHCMIFSLFVQPLFDARPADVLVPSSVFTPLLSTSVRCYPQDHLTSLPVSPY